MNQVKSKKFSLETLIDALGASEDQTIDEVKGELREDGIDVEAAMATLLKTVQECSMASRRIELDIAKRKRITQESSKPPLFGKFSSWTREQITKRIVEIAKASGGKLSFNFRDLEARSTEDMRSLLEDIEVALVTMEEEKHGS